MAIVVAGVRILTRSGRVLVDEAPPPEELDRIEATIAGGHARDRGYHKLRARSRAPLLHRPTPPVQPGDHAWSAPTRPLITARRDRGRAAGDAEVLIHVEPEPPSG